MKIWEMCDRNCSSSDFVCRGCDIVMKIERGEGASERANRSGSDAADSLNCTHPLIAGKKTIWSWKKTINMFIEASSWGGSRCQITVQIQSRLEVEILPTMTFLNYDLWKTITISWQFLEVWQCGSNRESFAELDPSAKLNSSNSTELVTGININFEPIFSHTTQYRKASSLSKKEVCVKLVLAYSSKKNSSHEKADLIKGWLSLVWRGRKFQFLFLK